MKKIIKVECMWEFVETNQDNTEILTEVKKGEYIAELNEETQEYFAKDSLGREFLVGEINCDGELILDDEFRLSGSDKIVMLKIEDELGYHILPSNCFVVKCSKCHKERDLVESDIETNDEIKPKKCEECGGENKFHYWLDSIYSEEEYEKLKENSKLKNK